MADSFPPAGADEPPALSVFDASELPRRARPWRRLLRVALVALALTALYALLGFQLAPYLLRRQAIAYVRDHYQRTLTLEAVRVHPFALYVELERLGFPDADGQPLLGLDRAHVDFEALASLWTRSYVFGRITLERPRVRAIVRPDGTINLADLAGSQPDTRGPAPRATDGGTSALRIRHLSVREGGVSYVDRDRVRPFTTELAPISFDVTNFQTTPGGGLFTLQAELDHQAHLAWSGDFSVTPVLRSAGELRVRRFPLRVAGEYLSDAMPFELLAGHADLRASYDVALDEHTRADLRVSELTVAEVALRARSEGGVEIALPKTVVREARALLHERHVDVGHLAISGLRTRVAREPDGTLDLARLLPRAPAASAPPVPQAPWTFELARFTLERAALVVEDRTVAPRARVAFAALNLELGHVGRDLSRAVSLTLDGVLEGGGRLHVSGDVTPAPAHAQLAVVVSDLPLALAQPYLRQRADLTVADGRVGLRGKLGLRTGAAGTSVLDAALEVALDDVSTRDARGQPLFGVRQLTLEGLRYAQQPPTLTVKQARLREPFARVVLHANQTLNVASVLASPRDVPAGPAPALPASIAPVDPETSAPLAPLSLRVDEVAIDAMRLSFTDHFVKPNFSAEIEALRGSLRGLASDPASRATLKLDGKLGGGAAVRVAGEVQPFSFQEASDVRLSWSNLTLALFNPYSGRFTGHNVRTGELSTDIHYRLRRRRLSATHKLRIDQLAWGEATDTQSEATLPVKLATALLRDKHGVIELDLPVQGRLDDPSFRLRPLLWQVAKNVIVKAASKPFALLGSLFQGAEQARFIHFEPGQVEPSKAAQGELAQLARALRDRPGLVLEVPMGALPELDREALVERKLQRALSSLMRRELRGARKHAAFASLDPGDKIDLLEALYEQLAGRDPPDPPEAPPAPREASFRQRRALRRAFEAEHLARQVRTKIVIDRGELDALGQERAESIERALTASGELAQSRVLLAKEGGVTREKSKVRLELAVR